MSTKNRLPLRVDPVLWEAFAQDRAEAPYGVRRPRRETRTDRVPPERRVRHPVPERCRGCDRALRRASVRAEDAPGTVAHAGRGLCHTCRRQVTGVRYDRHY